MTKDDIARARALIATCDGTIEMETVGGAYMSYEVPCAECETFYRAAFEGWPAALDRVEALEAECNGYQVTLTDATARWGMLIDAHERRRDQAIADNQRLRAELDLARRELDILTRRLK